MLQSKQSAEPLSSSLEQLIKAIEVIKTNASFFIILFWFLISAKLVKKV